MKTIPPYLKAIFFVLLLTMFSMVTKAQKVFMVFNGSGVPEELTLVDSNGVKIGYSNFYNKSGILTMSLMYKNGVPNGQWSRYDDKTGKIKESFVYVNGKLNGERCWFDESGNVIQRVMYNNGIRINFPKAENLWALEVVTPTTVGNAFRFVSISPAQSYINYASVYPSC
jgi:hypothetical protein